MINLRTLLGFALLGTVVWILWIAGRSTGADGVIWLIAFLLALGLLAWLLGKTQEAGATRNVRLLASVLVAFATTGIALLPLEPVVTQTFGLPTKIRAWNADEVRHLVERGRPVFVDFTANWCLLCKVNERTVLSTQPVATIMDELNFVRFRADWTLRNDAISAELQRHGSAGVPLYLVYRPGSPDAPELLSELLTIDRTIAALHRAVSPH